MLALDAEEGIGLEEMESWLQHTFIQEQNQNRKVTFQDCFEFSAWLQQPGDWSILRWNWPPWPKEKGCLQEGV